MEKNCLCVVERDVPYCGRAQGGPVVDARGRESPLLMIRSPHMAESCAPFGPLRRRSCFSSVKSDAQAEEDTDCLPCNAATIGMCSIELAQGCVIS